MRFAKRLRDIGDSFRLTHLDSDDIKDKTVLDEDWRKMEVSFLTLHVTVLVLLTVFIYRPTLFGQNLCKYRKFF